MLRFNFATKFEEDAETRRMLEGMGFPYDTESPDFIVYTGGSDVDPNLYMRGDEKDSDWNKYTDGLCSINTVRDRAGATAYNSGVPMLGICRGSQFLNVMCGYRLHRHILGHGIHGEHKVELLDGRTLSVTSTHHQCMSGEVANQHTYGHVEERTVLGRAGPVDEIVLFEPKGRGNILCIQGHPEYLSPHHEFPVWTRNAILKYLKGDN